MREGRHETPALHAQGARKQVLATAKIPVRSGAFQNPANHIFESVAQNVNRQPLLARKLAEARKIWVDGDRINDSMKFLYRSVNQGDLPLQALA